MNKPPTFSRGSIALLLGVAFGLMTLMLGLVIGGGAAALALADPGEVVRFGQPIAKLIFNFAMAASVGTLIFTAFAIAADSPLLGKALDLAAGASVVWGARRSRKLFAYLSKRCR